MEEFAGFYLDELIQRSLVQVTRIDERNRVKECRLHDLIREFIITKARNQNLATIITEKQEESQFLSSNDSTRRKPPRLLSISFIGGDQDNGSKILSENNTSCFHICSLFLFLANESWISRSSSTTLFTSFRLLRVLDIGYADLEEFPSQVVNLLYLRYLSLRSNYRISSVPDSVGKLIHLETLNLKNTIIKELPTGILKLRQLRNLFAFSLSGDNGGVKLPLRISSLTSLEKLEWIDADEEGSGILVKELGMLTQLRRLSICNLREDSMQLFASVQKMKYLRSFKVWSKSNKLLHSSNLSSPSPSLKCLHMDGAFGNIPGWIPSLQNLEELQLCYSGFKSDLIEVLQVLPNLVILGLLNGSFAGEELSFAKGGFPRLKTLTLVGLMKLNKVEVEEGSLPVIRAIRFTHCEKLKLLLGLESLTTLDEIISGNMWIGWSSIVGNQGTFHRFKSFRIIELL
ncbi:Disease resistance protein [Thalictrum thalictroides]|uniref:Disease resistance protein n=1 Tax=Thalictrum thalictroides TaxID=46969 RepID=A0A7J6WHG2_THATH|nr:Disease resistance protein [Thalictrum thalictroides]